MNTVEIDNELAALRAAFDDVDDAIIALLAQRQRLADHAGRLKRLDGRAVKDDAREAAANARRAEQSLAVDVDKALVTAVFEVVVEASRRRQQPATPAMVVRTR